MEALYPECVKTAENIKKVALILFLILGLSHILSGLSFSNNYFLPLSLIINRSLDIPFAMTAVVYGLASMYTGLPEKSHKLASIAFAAIALLIFVALVYINFFIKDKAPLA